MAICKCQKAFSNCLQQNQFSMLTNGPFPLRDAELNNYFITVVPYLISNKVRLGISAANITALTAMLTAWNTAYPPTTSASTRTQTLTDTKNASRQQFQDLLRNIYADIAESVFIPADRNTLNIHERGPRTEAPVPTTRPVCKVDTSKRLQHTIAFTDESTPSSRAKPDKVKGCEIWVKVGGESPIDPGELHYLATDTNSPYIAHFDGADAGKPGYYMIRWVNSHGDAGPWSETVMATITG